MNILFICHRFPYPPLHGARIRPFHIVRHLSRSHRVTVCSLTRSPQETEEARGIAEYCAEYHIAQVDERVQWARIIASLPTWLTASGSYFHSSRMARTIRQLIAQQHYDLIFVHCSSVAHYVQHVAGIPKILDFCDMDSQKWLEYARYKTPLLAAGYWWEGRRMLAAEKRFARRFDLCTTNTRAELQTLQDYGIGRPSAWFPNGVDHSYFAPSDAPYERDSIAFIGRMDYYPNEQAMRWFCDEVLPLVQRERPAVQLTIIGADPSPAVRQLGDRPGVTVTGSVPDVRPFVRRAALTVAPLTIARGTQNKMLESMAMGVPVVASRIAAGGVDAVAGEHLLTATSPSEYRDAIMALLSDDQYRQRLAVAGRERVVSNHSWATSMERLDTIIARCVVDRRGESASDPARTAVHVDGDRHA